MRALLYENKVKEAENVIADALKEKGFNRASLGRLLPLCDIDMVFDCSEGLKNYERVPDMETEEALVSWNEGNTTFKKESSFQEMTEIFIAGAKDVQNLDAAVQQRMMTIYQKGYDVLVGDCCGVDSSVQKFYSNLGYNNVVV